MNREELLKREDDAWLKFAAVLNAVPPHRRGEEGVVPGWSTHDLAWHCIYWAGYAGEFLERIHDGDPAPEDSHLSEPEILATGRGMSWDEVIGRAEQSRERVRAALSSLDDPPTLAVEWFTDDTFGHYEEHGAEIRAFSG